MATVTLRTLGGSVVMAVPKQILGMLHMEAGSQVEVKVENGKLIVEPKTGPRYSLAQLLAQCDASGPLSAEEDTWLAAKSVGSELL